MTGKMEASCEDGSRKSENFLKSDFSLLNDLPHPEKLCGGNPFLAFLALSLVILI